MKCGFDQLILFDDERWIIQSDKSEVIHRIIEETMYVSKIFEEWQIIKYLNLSGNAENPR